MHEIVGTMRASTIEEVALGLPPGCPADCPDPEKPVATWLELTVRAPDQGPGRVRAYWEGLLAAGAFRDESYARGLPEVLGKTINVMYPDGTVERGPETVISQPMLHNIAQSSTSTIETLFTDGAKRANVRIESLTFLQPMRQATALIISASDAKSLVQHRDEFLNDLAGDIAYDENPLVEGILIEVRDDAGQPITSSAYSVRTGEGLGWTRPDLAEDVTSSAGLVPDL
jgi:hypothetical protein